MPLADPRIVSIACLLSLVLALSSCGSGSDPGGAAERTGGVAVVGMPHDIGTLNPLATIDLHGFLVQQHLLFTPLFRLDDRMEAVPALVEQWDTVRIGPDSLALTLKLRNDVAWHDGRPTTAADVHFTFARALDPNTAFPQASLLGHVNPEVELLDEHGIRLRIQEHSDYLIRLASLIPVPKHLLGDVPPATLRTHSFGRAPVGNGPFRFLRAESGDRLVLEANGEHPAALGGAPRLDRVVLRTIPDAATRVSELLTGGIDLLIAPAPEHTERIARAEGVEVRSAEGIGSLLLVWNGRHRPLDDPRMRRALTMAIDREAIVEGALNGHATPGASMLRPVDRDFDPSSALPHSPVQAARLLDEMGWSLRGGNGVRTDTAGRPLRFEVVSLPELRDVLVVMQAQLRRVGVDVRPRIVDPRTLDRLVDGEPVQGGGRDRSFEAALFEVNMFAKDDTPLLHSRFRDDPWGAAGYADPRVDVLLERIPFILDPEDARPLRLEYQARVARDAPITVVLYPHRLVGVRTDLQGVEVGPAGELSSAVRWWRRKDRTR